MVNLINRRRFMQQSGNVIMTSASNPEVMAICASKGWCGADKMTIEEAAAVSDISNAFYNSNITHFDEFVYFTGITQIPANAFVSAPLTTIQIPSTVTKISAYAFQNCSSLATITIPSTVNTIATGAFINCSALALTELPDTITSIGNSAFRDCTSLALTKLPNGITSIGVGAFQNCSNLALSSLPSGITTISTMAFYNCSSLALTELPSGLTSIESQVFYNCTNLNLTELPSGITSIPAYTFFNCKNMALESLPPNLESIGNGAFQNCSNIIINNIPDTVTSIGSAAFYACSNLQLSSLSSSLTTIENQTFNGCSSMTLSSLPDSITSIGISAFGSCRGITISSLPQNLSTLGANAFNSCTSIPSITIPATLTEIGDGAFAYCYNCSAINCYGSTAPTIGSSTFNATGRFATTRTIYVPLDAENYDEGYWLELQTRTNYSYTLEHVIMTSDTNPEVMTICANKGWSKSNDIMSREEAAAVTSLETAFRQSNIVHFDELQYFTGLSEIYDRAFQNTTTLTSVVLPSQITRIGVYSFYNCPIGETELPDGITDIDGYAFSGCLSLVATSLPSALTHIGTGAFQNCRNVRFTKWIAGAGNVIPTACFAFNQQNPSFHITSNVTKLEDQSFRSNYNIGTLRCDAMVAPTLGEQVFNYCGHTVAVSDRRLVVPIGATGYNTGDWQDLQDTWGYTLEHIIMTKESNPEVLEICHSKGWAASEDFMTKEEAEAVNNFDSAFKGNTDITHFEEFQYFTSYTTLAGNEFMNCTSLESITLPSNLTNMGRWTFQNCSALTSIVIPSGVTALSDGIFYGCTNLASCDMPNGITSIGTMCFVNCTNLVLSELPSSLISIGSNAFANDSNITISELPSGLTTLSSGVFSNSINVSISSVPQGITSIPASCFHGCWGITEFTFHSGITSVGASAFNYNYYLSLIKCEGTTAPAIEASTFNNTGQRVSTRTLQVPSGTTDYDDGYWLELQSRSAYPYNKVTV